MTISDAFLMALEQLRKLYDDREARNIAEMLMDDLFDIRNNRSEKTFVYQDQLEKSILRLLTHEPIQYVTGVAHFYGLKLKVNSHVLIPRPETEELVNWILTDVKGSHRQLDVMDVGLGSGCISLTLKKKKNSLRLFGIDNSLDALNVARINSRSLNAPMLFFNFDFLNKSYWSEMGMMDIIVSNPPYVLEKDRKIMADHVLLHEPEKALFPGSDYLIFYKAIHEFAKEHLNDSGWIYLEIHEDLAEKVAQIFKETKTKIEIRKDLQGKDRMMKITYQ